MAKAGIDIHSDEFRRLNRRYLLNITEQVPKSVRHALKRGNVTARTEIQKGVNKRINQRRLPAGRLKEEIQKNTKDRTNTRDVDKMEIVITMPKRGYSLSRFVVGRLKPLEQGGIPTRQRRQQRVKIKVGNTQTVLKTSFIAKAKGRFKSGRRKDQQNYQVYQRKGKKRIVRGTQSVKSLTHHFMFGVVQTTNRSMQRTAEKDLKWRLAKTSPKARNKARRRS